MTSPLHSKQTLADGIHSPVAFTYSSVTALNAASGFVTEDLYKLALVTDTNQLYCLTTVSPASWTAVRFTGFTDGGGKLKTTASFAASGQSNIYADGVGTDVYFYASGSLDGTQKSVFGGNVVVSGSGVFKVGLTGTLQQTAGGLSYLVAGTNITITSQSNGQIVITAATNAAGQTITGTWRDPGNTLVTTASVSIDASNRTVSTLGSDVFFFVSGSSGVSSGANRKVNLFGGDSVHSGSDVFLAGLTGTLQQTAGGLSYLVGGTNISVTSQSNGQVVVASTYVTPTVTGTWRDPGNTLVTTASVSIDASNRTATSLGTDVFLFVSGSVSRGTPSDPERHVVLFGGDTFTSGTGVFNSGLSGSVQRLPSGLSYLVGGTSVSVTTQSNGQVVIASTYVTPTVTGTWRDAGSSVLVTTGAVSVDTSNRSVSSLGSDVFFFVSGSVGRTTPTDAERHVALFGGSLVVSGTGHFINGLSGSLQQTVSGLSYLVGGTSVSVTTQSNGQVVIASTYVTPTVTGTWRDAGNSVLVTTGAVSIDTGNRAVSSLGSDVFFFVSGSVNRSSPADAERHVALFGGSVVSSGSGHFLSGLTGSLQSLPSGISYFAGTNGVNVTTASNGQVIASLSNFSGDVSGTLAAPVSVISISGPTLIPISASTTVLANNTSTPVTGGVLSGQSTGSTGLILLVWPHPDNTVADWSVSFLGRNHANNGDFRRSDYTFTTQRYAAGSLFFYPSAPTSSNVRTGSVAASNWGPSVITGSGNNVLIEAVGSGSVTVDWSVIYQVQLRS